MFSKALRAEAEKLIADLRQRGAKMTTAESCTGGLIAGLLTEIAGASEVVDRGFVTYSNASKMQMLGVSGELLARFGAVSREVAIAMAEGALIRAAVDVSVAVTGVTGPGGGTDAKPVGLVHIAAGRSGAPTLHAECRFGAVGRTEVRLQAIGAALALVQRALAQTGETDAAQGARP